MTITYDILSFPTFPISKQLFYASGQAVEGGLTVGGVRSLSPEPGGRASLEIQPALQVTERDYPLSSWLMSKTNGDIFRIRLAPTPQILFGGKSGPPWAASGINPETPWSNQQNWSGDTTGAFYSAALQGSTVVRVDMSVLGRVLQPGHLIGHMNHCYMVDKITYDGANVATITVNPPFRKAIAVNDVLYYRPFFLGVISNGSEMRKSYDADQNGNIQINLIKFDEVII